MLRILALLLARPTLADWIIQRAKRTPYFHLKGEDGSMYMERYWLFNPYDPKSDKEGRRLRDLVPSIRIHRIMREDRDDHLHDHPWNARTFILRGWYREEREEYNCVHCNTHFWYRPAGSTAELNFGEFHRITQVAEGGVWTLFVTWRKRGSWGFLVGDRKVPWREHLGIEEGA